MTALALIDYGMGNIRSVLNAFTHLGVEATLITDPADVAKADKVVLPGVGAIADAMANLRSSGMAEALDRHVQHERPLLGICLGMQLLCRTSTEDGQHEGFGWAPADVRAIPAKDRLKVPHMGWNSLHPVKQDLLLKGIDADVDVYFVHSYFVDCQDRDVVVTETEYGITFTSMLRSGNTWGVQFHPEKSQAVGLQILHNFLMI